MVTVHLFKVRFLASTLLSCSRFSTAAQKLHNFHSQVFYHSFSRVVLMLGFSWSWYSLLNAMIMLQKNLALPHFFCQASMSSWKVFV